MLSLFECITCSFYRRNKVNCYYQLNFLRVIESFTKFYEVFLGAIKFLRYKKIFTWVDFFNFFELGLKKWPRQLPISLLATYLMYYSKRILKIQATAHPRKTNFLEILTKQVLCFKKLISKEMSPQRIATPKESINKQTFQLQES